MTYIDDMKMHAQAIIDIANSQLPVAPPSFSWVYNLNGANPFYGADFVNGNYYALGAAQPNFESFISAANFIGNSAINADGLIMGAPKNKIWPSNNFTHTRWLRTGLNVSNNLLTETSSNTLHQIYQIVPVIAGSTNTASILVDAGTRTKGRIYCNQGGIGILANFDLANGTISSPTANTGGGTALSATITPENGMYRITISGIAAGLTSVYLILMLRNNSGAIIYPETGGTMYVYEAQLESGANFTGYQETIAASSNPSLIKNIIAPPNAVTRILRATTAPMLPADQYQVLHHLDNNVNTTNGYSDIEVYRGANGNLFVECKRSSTTTISGRVDLGFVANNTNFAVAYTASAAGIIASLNGGIPVTSNIVTWPTDLTQNRLNGNITGIRQWGGSLAHDTLFFGTATGPQLQAFTA